jgi:hypothetical protein
MAHPIHSLCSPHTNAGLTQPKGSCVRKSASSFANFIPDPIILNMMWRAMRCLNRTMRSFLLLRSAVLITRGLPFARAYPLSPRVYRPPAHIIRLQSANDRMLMSAGDAYLVDAVNSVELVQPPTMPKSRSSTPTSTSSADAAPPFDTYAYVAVCACVRSCV